MLNMFVQGCVLYKDKLLLELYNVYTRYTGIYRVMKILRQHYVPCHWSLG